MTTLPETTKIVNEIKDGWLTIWFDSPENRNAMSEQFTTDFMATLNAVKDDRSIRGITLRGKHGIFCAGGDLKQFGANQSSDADSQEATYKMNHGAGDMFDLVMGMPQVVVAFVEGAAIAGGLGLMCCADIICVTEDAKFSLTETMIGIPPAQIAPIIVGRVGLPRARQLMLTGARFTGADTDKWGLSDYIVQDPDGFAEVEAGLIKGVKKCAPGAIGLTKQILMATPHLDRAGQKDFAAKMFTKGLLSDEGREGIASFIEKRKPSWADE